MSLITEGKVIILWEGLFVGLGEFWQGIGSKLEKGDPGREAF